MKLCARVPALLGLALFGSCMLLTPTSQPPEPWLTESGLTIYDLVEPEGVPVVQGQTVEVHYTAYYGNSKPFDSSRDRGTPIRFVAGTGQVPVGFDESVIGMVPGAVRRVVVPPELAYGEEGIPGIVPPNALVTFDIELMSAEAMYWH